MDLTLAQLQFCRSLTGEALLAAPLPDDPLAATTTLRKSCDRDQAAAVMQVRDVRDRAARSGKLPRSIAARMLATDTLLQQASSLRTAVYVGGKLAAVAGDREILDLCCGAGFNSIGLALAGAMAVVGYDRSPEAVFCAAHNAGVAGMTERCSFVDADVTHLSLDEDAIVHIDPDRRANKRRTVSLSDCSPNVDFLRSLPGRTGAGVMKLSPALPIDEVADWPEVQLEHLSEDGICKQLLLWWGGVNESARTATVLTGEPTAPVSVSLPAGVAEVSPVAEPGPWLIEPDPAVIAAGAVDDLAAHCASRGEPAWRIAPGLNWLFSANPIDTPLARCYRILDTAPGRERDIAAACRSLDGGLVEIKPRGVKLDTDALQRRLRGKGRQTLTVLWCRLGEKQQAFIAERRVEQ